MIYMTTDEWKEISKIIEEKDFSKLATEITVRTYDLHLDKQELDCFMRCVTDEKYKTSKTYKVIYLYRGSSENERACFVQAENETQAQEGFIHLMGNILVSSDKPEDVIVMIKDIVKVG